MKPPATLQSVAFFIPALLRFEFARMQCTLGGQLVRLIALNNAGTLEACRISGTRRPTYCEEILTGFRLLQIYTLVLCIPVFDIRIGFSPPVLVSHPGQLYDLSR